ncbi:MAG: S24 family peptidase [Clostridiales bacterium]|nr:S24 family peptidase [Clostridiales bacterium]
MPTKTKKSSLLGESACGEPIYTDQYFESYVEVSTDVRADFTLRCRGDSIINARIFDGDIAFIRKQDIVNDGEIAAVIIENEATLKRFIYHE